VSDQQYQRLQVSTADGIGRIVIQGSNDLNALDLQTTQELLAVTSEFAESDDIRCIVLEGEGEAFGVGADLSLLSGDESDASDIRALAATLHAAIEQLHYTRTPVVTAINGTAAGAGFSLGILGDIVLIKEDATLNYAYSGIGLTGDGGVTFYLPRLVGLRKAKEICLLNEPISAQEAVELNLATESVSGEEFDSRVAEVAAKLAAGPTKAYGTTKALLTQSSNSTLSEQLAAEADAISQAVYTDDYSEGVAAFTSGKDPEFSGQ